MPGDVGFRARPSSASDAVEFHADQVTIDTVTALIERVKLSIGDPGSAVDVSAAHPMPTADAAAAAALAGIETTLTSILGGEATQSTLAQLLTQLAALTSANHTDLAAVLAKLPASPALDATVSSGFGSPGTGVQPISGGGSGALGLLRMIWDTLRGTLTIGGSVAVSSLPGSVAQDGTDATGVAAPAGGAGIRGWLSGIYNRLGGTLTVSVAASADVAGTLTDGRKTVTTPGTAVALRGSLACKWVTVTALLTNTKQVNVGGSGVLATAGSDVGTPLNPGDSVTVPASNATLVFVDAQVAGEGVSFTVGS